jgi:hypothetical protein
MKCLRPLKEAFLDCVQLKNNNMTPKILKRASWVSKTYETPFAKCFQTVAISRSEDVLRPFLLACEQKNTKMLPIAVGTIHKLIVHHAVDVVSIKKQ